MKVFNPNKKDKLTGDILNFILLLCCLMICVTTIDSIRIGLKYMDWKEAFKDRETCRTCQFTKFKCGKPECKISKDSIKDLDQTCKLEREK
jgi:hypothetical protein